jgi:hypothetical protein
MRKVSVFVAVCTLAIACVVMAGGSVSGHALSSTSMTLAATDSGAAATAAAADEQLPAPGITPAAAPKAPAEAAATVRTDKFDYAPGETAIITGTGFAPGENVTLEVDHASGLADGDGHLPFTALADGSGNIESQWFVNPDDSLHSIFILTAVGETSGRKATSVFTDLLQRFVDDQGADDEPGQKDLNFFTFEGIGTTSLAITWGWDDTSWSGSNSGDACALIDVDLSANPGGPPLDGKANFAYCVTVKGTPATTFATRMYSCGNKSSDRCSQKTALVNNPASTASAAVSGNADPFGTHATPPTPDTYDPAHLASNTCGTQLGCITDDTVAVVNLLLSDTGSTTARVLNVCSYPSQEPNSDPSECVLAPNSGFLTIKKVAPANSDLFGFDLGDGAANDGTTHWEINGPGTVLPSLIPIAPGKAYDLTETFTSAWNNTLGSCEIQSSPTKTSTGSFAAPKISNFEIAAGLETVCTFTNAVKEGTLVVKKNVVNDNGGTKTAADFTLHVKSGTNDVTGSPAAGSAAGVSYSLAPGTYVVSEESPPSGYMQTGFSGDCNASGSVTVTAGGSVTCTITNDDQPAKLTVTKHVINDNGGVKVASDFKITITGTATVTNPALPFDGSETGTEVTLNAGSYSVDEQSDLGYTKTIGNNCSGTIAVGESKTCTITNDDKPNAVAIVTKQRVILHDRATISGIVRNANETSSTVTFRIYQTKVGDTCTTELGSEVVNVVLGAGDTSTTVGTTTGVEVKLDAVPGSSTTTRYWRAFYSGNNISGGGVLNSPQETGCTEVTTVTMQQ